MVIRLTLHGRDVSNFFHLLGEGEDGMTRSLCWALKYSPSFLERICSKVRLGGNQANIYVDLQRSRSGFGRTDVEITSTGVGKVIIEAKRGYSLPTESQLLKYAEGQNTDQDATSSPLRSIVVLTAYPETVTHQDTRAPQAFGTTPIKYLSWHTIKGMAERSFKKAFRPERRVLGDFINYLGGLLTMQDRQSNMVYVVSLNRNNFGGGKLSFVDVVRKRSQYFHPVGNRYATSPPNYLGFRYDGQLQSIHFVDGVKVFTKFSKHFPGTSSEEMMPHFLYTLGPEIIPKHTVKSGPIQNMRCYCMLDTLLTCESIREALSETKKRLGEEQ